MSRAAGSRGVIGIDLGARHVRMLQLADGSGGRRVTAAAAQELPAGVAPTDASYHEAVARAITAMCGEVSFTGRRAVSALPTQVMHFKSVRLPRMPADELAQAVAWETREASAFGGEPVEVGHLSAGEVRQGEELRQEVIVIAAPTAFAEAHVAALLKCGLDPVALDATPSALQRCLQLCRSTNTGDSGGTGDTDSASAQLVLDVGHGTSKAAIVRGGSVLFFKLIDIAGRHFDETVAQRMNVSLPEAVVLRREAAGAAVPSDAANVNAVREAVRPQVAELAREVGLCLRYYAVTFRSERPGEVLLTGGEAADASLATALAEDLGASVRAVDVLAGVDAAPWAHVLDAGPGRPAWATVAGMAQRREGESQPHASPTAPSTTPPTAPGGGHRADGARRAA